MIYSIRARKTPKMTKEGSTCSSSVWSFHNALNIQTLGREDLDGRRQVEAMKTGDVCVCMYEFIMTRCNRFLNHFFFPSIPLLNIAIGSCLFHASGAYSAGRYRRILLKKPLTLGWQQFGAASQEKPIRGDMMMSEASSARPEMKGNSQ